MVRGAKIEMVAQHPIDESYEAVGTVRAKTSIVVSSKVMGNIVAMKVREGEQFMPAKSSWKSTAGRLGIQTQQSGAGLVEMTGALG